MNQKFDVIILFLIKTEEKTEDLVRFSVRFAKK